MGKTFVLVHGTVRPARRRPDEIAADHCVALSRPNELTDLLDSHIPAHTR